MTPEELLMQELRDVINDAGKAVNADDRSEMIEVLRLTSMHIDQDIADDLTHLFVMREVSTDEARGNTEDDNAIVIDRNVPEEMMSMATGAKITHLAEMPDAESLQVALTDQKAMTFVAGMSNPIGLMFRTTTDSGRFMVMALPMGIATERKRTDGVILHRAYLYDDGQPEDLDTYSEQEADLMRYISQALMLPKLFKKEYPQAFQALWQEIHDSMEREFGDKDDE